MNENMEAFRKASEQGRKINRIRKAVDELGKALEECIEAGIDEIPLQEKDIPDAILGLHALLTWEKNPGLKPKVEVDKPEEAK